MSECYLSEAELESFSLEIARKVERDLEMTQDLDIDVKGISDTIEAVKKDEVINTRRGYYQEIQKNPLNKRSLWLNFIAFFLPLWGIFMGFYHLLRRPRRAKGLFIVSIISLIIQGIILLILYNYTFKALGAWFIVLFG